MKFKMRCVEKHDKPLETYYRFQPLNKLGATMMHSLELNYPINEPAHFKVGVDYELELKQNEPQSKEEGKSAVEEIDGIIRRWMAGHFATKPKLENTIHVADQAILDWLLGTPITMEEMGKAMEADMAAFKPEKRGNDSTLPASMETRIYADGTKATGKAPLPAESPAAKDGKRVPTPNDSTDIRPTTAKQIRECHEVRRHHGLFELGLNPHDYSFIRNGITTHEGHWNDGTVIVDGVQFELIAGRVRKVTLTKKEEPKRWTAADYAHITKGIWSSLAGGYITDGFLQAQNHVITLHKGKVIDVHQAPWNAPDITVVIKP